MRIQSEIRSWILVSDFNLRVYLRIIFVIYLKQDRSEGDTTRAGSVTF